jgi:hypothetical protein
MLNALMKKFISQPERMGAPTQSRNILGIKHPLAESSPVARIPISMMPGGGPVSGYTQEDLATLKLPEETTLFSPFGYDITDKDLAKVGLATDAMDLLPGAAIVGGMATGAGLLGRALKGADYAPTSTEDIASALLTPALQRRGLLDEAMVGGVEGATNLAKAGNNRPALAIELAKRLENEGVSRDEIWTRTSQSYGYGVYRGKDGKLRFEIDDSAARTRGIDEDKVTRGAIWKTEDAIEHPEFYDMNPDARLLQIRDYPGQGGRYIPSERTIEIGARRSTSPLEFKSTGLHELQHATQEAEGFARGGNPEMFTDWNIDALRAENKRHADRFKHLVQQESDKGLSLSEAYNSIKDTDEMQMIATNLEKLQGAIKEYENPYRHYQRLAGEAEARQVQARMDMSPAERAYKPFYADFDVPEADQIVRYGDGPSAMVTYQGSPHKFEALDPTKIGTGQGAQTYGHGAYVAQNPDVGKGYQKSVPYAEMKRKFLEEIPEDAEFDELMDLVAEGHFSPEQERVLKALEADDWLGFDYPSQAISEAYGPYLKNFDPSPELVESVKGLSGHFYEIDVPDEDIAKMLDWDKPLSEQSESVRAVLSSEMIDKMSDRELLDAFLSSDVATQFPHSGEVVIANRILEESNPQYLAEDIAAWADSQRNMKGMAYNLFERDNAGALYERLASRLGGAEKASEALQAAGIPGIKYYDQGSRAAGEGTRNMVLFDELARRAKVLKRNDEAIAQPSVDEFIGDLARTPQELTIRDDVPNLGSIRSSLTNWEEVPGIQQIPMSEFNAAPRDLFYAADDLAHVDSLANEIRQSGEISPLIVVQDSEGYYVLEGAHRLGALHEMGQPSVPALVIKDLDNPVEPSVDEFIGKLLDDELPLDEASRMQRAQEMGFTTDAYHGSTRDITSFDSSLHGSPEGHYGPHNYFTSSQDDLLNYSGEGPDLTGRIEREAEQIADDLDDNLIQDYFDSKGVDIDSDNITDAQREDAIYGIARDTLGLENAGVSYPLKLKTDKLVRVGVDDETFFDFKTEWSEDGEDILGEEGAAIDLRESLRSKMSEWNVYQGTQDDVIGKLQERMMDYGGLSATDFENVVRAEVTDLYDDMSGAMASPGALISEVYQDMGYEGVLQNAEASFGRRPGFGGAMIPGMEGVVGAEHYIQFKPSNIRSKFAKFDPSKKDSANILAGAAGAGVLSGLYEPNALKDDEKMRRALLRN